jgi:hypothetical protein
MFRRPIAPSPRELWKWCAYALILLAPGSFVVLPLLWLARQFGNRASLGGLGRPLPQVIDAVGETAPIGIGGSLSDCTPATPPGMRVRTGRFEKLRS